MPYAKIAGTGGYLPSRVVSNEDLAAELATRGIETSDEWITERTGIRQRHIAGPEVKTSMLAAEAAKRAMADAGVDPADIDLLIVATSTPDVIFPSTACLVQAQLGIHQGAGFSSILDWDDRRTCVLFGDGAGAVVLKANDEPGILAAELHADGSQQGILCANGRIVDGQVVGDPFVRMDGQAVFKMAVNSLSKSAHDVCRSAGVDLADIDWMVPHQANVRILNFLGKKLGIPTEKIVITLDQHANTSAASVPLALDVARRDGRVKKGDLVLMQGVGGGFTWGSVLARM